MVPIRSTAADIMGTCWEVNFLQGRERDIFSIPFSRPDRQFFLEIPKPIAVSMRGSVIVSQRFSALMQQYLVKFSSVPCKIRDHLKAFKTSFVKNKTISNGSRR